MLRYSNCVLDVGSQTGAQIHAIRELTKPRNPVGFIFPWITHYHSWYWSAKEQNFVTIHKNELPGIPISYYFSQGQTIWKCKFTRKKERGRQFSKFDSCRLTVLSTPWLSLDDSWGVIVNPTLTLETPFIFLTIFFAWTHTLSLHFVDRISTFIRPILMGCFYQFAATNWQRAIILFTVIEVFTFTGKRRMTIDINGASASVICQIFQEFSV